MMGRWNWFGLRHEHHPVPQSTPAQRIEAGLLDVRRSLVHLFNTLHDMEIRNMALLDKLIAQVAANTTVIQSAKDLIAGLADQIKDAGTDQVKLDELTDELAVADTDLAAAVAANTVAAPVVESSAVEVPVTDTPVA